MMTTNVSYDQEKQYLENTVGSQKSFREDAI